MRRWRHVCIIAGKTVDLISQWMGLVTGVLILLIVFGIFSDVFARFVLNSPQALIYGIYMFFFGIAIMLGGCYTHWRRGHVRVDILYSRLSRRAQSIIDAVLAVTLFAVVAVLIWKGTEAWWYALKVNWRVDGIESLPLWPLLLAIPIGGLLLAAQGIVQLVRDITYTCSGNKLK